MQRGSLPIGIISIAVIIISLLIVIITHNIRYNKLHKTYYTLGNKGIKIVFIQDVHNKTFGENNENFIKTVQEENPDLIILGGDLVNGSEENIEIAKNLIGGLSNITKCYAVLGNHEKALTKLTELSYYDIYSPSNVELLDNKFDTISIKGYNIMITGMTPWQFRSKTLDKDEKKLLVNYKDYLEKNLDNTDYTIFVTHSPLLFEDTLQNIETDLVLCGHIHGGQIQIPFIGGLYHPDLGIFPEYAQGLHDLKHGKLIISRGIGNNAVIPRINNTPEIVVISI